MYYYLLGLVAFVISLTATLYLRTTYSKAKDMGTKKGLSGFEVASTILEANGLGNLYVVETKGDLTDHYDPKNRVVRLSSDIFHGTSIASAAVAAHEVGHAIQDKEGYLFIRARKFLVPFANFASTMSYVVIVLGAVFGLTNLIYAGIVLLLGILLFQLITLPVEFNASKRGKQELEKWGIISEKEKPAVTRMLTAAALTYVSGVLTSVIEILRLLLIFGDRRD